MSFENKVVIVTGAASGLGAATAKLFSKEGAHVVVVDKNEEKLAKTTEYCEQNGKKPVQIVADLTNDDDTKRVIEETINKHGKLDILVNCAGIIKSGLILDGTVVKAFDEVIGTNLRAIVTLTTFAAPYLVKTKGNIVNISSMGDRVAVLPFAAYCVTKAGVSHFTKGAALELGPSGVRVNAISPGFARTNLYDELFEPDFDEHNKYTVLGKVVEPEEIADLVAYLASEKAKSITGASYLIDNGYTILHTI